MDFRARAENTRRKIPGRRSLKRPFSLLFQAGQTVTVLSIHCPFKILKYIYLILLPRKHPEKNVTETQPKKSKLLCCFRQAKQFYQFIAHFRFKIYLHDFTAQKTTGEKISQRRSLNSSSFSAASGRSNTFFNSLLILI